jgi:hypothetical protein
MFSVIALPNDGWMGRGSGEIATKERKEQKEKKFWLCALCALLWLPSVVAAFGGLHYGRKR